MFFRQNIRPKVLKRDNIGTVSAVSGPLIVEDPDATIVVPPGDSIEMTANGHLLIRINKELRI